MIENIILRVVILKVCPSVEKHIKKNFMLNDFIKNALKSKTIILFLYYNFDGIFSL